MPYDNNGTGFNPGSYTSWLAAEKQRGKRETQQLRILGLYATGYGVWRQGCLGICSWHVKTALDDMFCKGQTSAWTARLADMASPVKPKPAEFRLVKLADADGCHETWEDPEGVERVLYFRHSEVSRVGLEIQRSLF